MVCYDTNRNVTNITHNIRIKLKSLNQGVHSIMPPK